FPVLGSQFSEGGQLAAFLFSRVCRAILAWFMNLTLNSKVALITGGSRGIGASAVRLFAAAGAKVVFNYRAAKVQAEDLVSECGAGNCRAVQSDLSTTEAA